MEYFCAKKGQFCRASVRSDKAIEGVDAAVTQGPAMASIQPHNQVIVLPIISAALGFSDRSLVKSD